MSERAARLTFVAGRLHLEAARRRSRCCHDVGYCKPNNWNVVTYQAACHTNVANFQLLRRHGTKACRENCGREKPLRRLRDMAERCFRWESTTRGGQDGFACDPSRTGCTPSLRAACPKAANACGPWRGDKKRRSCSLPTRRRCSSSCSSTSTAADLIGQLSACSASRSAFTMPAYPHEKIFGHLSAH